MSTYQYVARTHQGKMVTGQTEGEDEASIARMLREQGLIPTSIELGASRVKTPKVDKGKRGSHRKQLALSIEHLGKA